MTLTLQVEPTDEEENREHWVNFIEGLPESLEKHALQFLWNQPPTEWHVLDRPHMLTIDILHTWGRGLSAWITNLTSRLSPVDDASRGDYWTMHDPNVIRHNNRALAITQPAFRMICDPENVIPMSIGLGWMHLTSNIEPILILDHVHTWECIHQIWIG